MEARAHRPRRLPRALQPARGGALLLAVASLSSTAAERPEVSIPRLPAPPRLEAFLSMEPQGEIERRMARVEGFTQRQPYDGRPASQPTHVYLGYDDERLYAVFVAFDDEPEKIRAHWARRETVFGDDIVEIMLDTFNDQRRAYAFVCNPFGVQWDALWTEGTEFDMAFDTVWHSQGRMTERGYVVWMAIPFRSLRFPRTPQQRWGLILVRDIPRNSESSFWPRVSERIEGRLNQAGLLTGLEGISLGRHVQFIPFGATRSFRVLEEDGEGSVRWWRDRADPDAGLDAKFVFRDALVLDVTVHPDFSEVESDSPQATINERFEVFFPEKRPFFLENAGFFATPIDLLFTRRIVEPRFGTRLTGKLGPHGLGLLWIDDDAPVESTTDASLAGRRARIGVLRASRDVGRQSRIGVLLTDRRLGGAFNRVAGLDARLKFGEHWTLDAQAATSRSRDSGASRRAGPAYLVELRRSGRAFESQTRYRDAAPGFAAELGFVPRTDIRSLRHESEYRFWQAQGALLQWGPEISFESIWDHAGERLEWEVAPELAWEFPRRTVVRATYSRGAERLRPVDFPELAQTVQFERRALQLAFGTRTSARLGGDIRYRRGRGINFVPPAGEAPSAADIAFLDGELTLRPTRRLRLDGQYLRTRLRDPARGGAIVRDQIARLKGSYQWGPRSTLRAILQYEATRGAAGRTRAETSRRLNADLLYAYIVNPWTALYAGYTGDFQDARFMEEGGAGRLVPAPGLHGAGRQFFVKLTYLLRP